MNLDELQEQIEQDELRDAEFITPIQFARLNGFAPQTVYYWIRTKQLQAQRCQCGRTVVRVQDANEIFTTKTKSRGRNLARRPEPKPAGVTYNEGLRATMQDVPQEDTVEGVEHEV